MSASGNRLPMGVDQNQRYHFIYVLLNQHIIFLSVVNNFSIHVIIILVYFIFDKNNSTIRCMMMS